MTHTIAIKWKEKCDTVVVDSHHSLRLCGDRMKMSLPNKKKKNKQFFFFLFLFFFYRLFSFLKGDSLSPWVPFRVKFRPLTYSLLLITYPPHVFECMYPPP